VGSNPASPVVYISKLFGVFSLYVPELFDIVPELMSLFRNSRPPTYAAQSRLAGFVSVHALK
jgi:hypothetical protein